MTTLPGVAGGTSTAVADVGALCVAGASRALALPVASAALGGFDGDAAFGTAGVAAEAGFFCVVPADCVTRVAASLPRGHDHHVAANAARPTTAMPATTAIAVACDCLAGAGAIGTAEAPVDRDSLDSTAAASSSVASGSTPATRVVGTFAGIAACSAVANACAVWKRSSARFASALRTTASIAGGKLHVERRRRQRILLQHLLHRRRRRAGERPLAGQELVEDDAGREEIRAPVDRQSHDLLGRHVVRRADDGADLRQVRRFDVRDAEVGDLHRAVGAAGRCSPA